MASASGMRPDGSDHPPLAHEALVQPLFGQASDAAHDRPNGLHLSQSGVDADVKFADDGRLDITISDSGGHNLDHIFESVHEEKNPTIAPQTGSQPFEEPSGLPVPKLNIVVQVVGSRGDVQPFIALGQVLRNCGHRVRLATHATFKTFVEENLLEFFSIGGDPAELMAFMVKNPGLLPGIESLRAGDVGKRRNEMAEIIDGCWRSCIEGGDGLHVETEGDAGEENSPFIADAIIANPPSFAHIHCAERLQVPLHIMFTMPWSPTKAFPHPLANLLTANVSPNKMNYLSYALVETMTWQGLGDLINNFRVKKLNLSPVDPTFAPGMMARLKIPHTYAWSPALIPRPRDWGAHLSIAGFFSLPLGSAYTPPNDLMAFLNSGPPPIYIGFGSIVVDDPEGLTKLVFETVHKLGIRALVSRGWGGLGKSDIPGDANIFMLGNCPHDWLFTKVSCIVHHGGAGTTAAGIASGKPTVIVPFFGDQPFWGDMIARSGAGPLPIPYRQLTAQRLAEAITEALQPAMSAKALEMAAAINKECGSETGASAFHSQLPLRKMRCCILPGRVAVWKVARTDILLSAMAAALLISEAVVDIDQLRLYGCFNQHLEHGASDPLSASVTVGYGIISDILSGFSNISRGMYRSQSIQSEGSSNINSVLASSQAGAQPTQANKLNSATPPQASTSPSATKKGLKKLGAVPFKATANLTSSLADGLHNAPKLYGDKTVRTQGKVTGWQSGLKAGGKELGLGVYDGFTGVVTQATAGQKAGGRSGMYKGIGKGLGGLVFKPIAGVAGLFGFTFRGIHKEIIKKHGASLESYLRAARMASGFEECRMATVEDRADIIRRWNNIQKQA